MAFASLILTENILLSALTLFSCSSLKKTMFIYVFSESLDVNDALMELFIVAYACRTACAKRIIGKEYIQHSLI